MFLLDWLVRWWRVETALFFCYFDSWQRGDDYSCRYCANKSIFVSAFWIVVLAIVLCLLGFLFGR